MSARRATQSSIHFYRTGFEKHIISEAEVALHQPISWLRDTSRRIRTATVAELVSALHVPHSYLYYISDPFAALLTLKLLGIPTNRDLHRYSSVNALRMKGICCSMCSFIHAHFEQTRAGSGITPLQPDTFTSAYLCQWLSTQNAHSSLTTPSVRLLTICRNEISVISSLRIMGGSLILRDSRVCEEIPHVEVTLNDLGHGRCSSPS